MTEFIPGDPRTPNHEWFERRRHVRSKRIDMNMRFFAQGFPPGVAERTIESILDSSTTDAFWLWPRDNGTVFVETYGGTRALDADLVGLALNRNQTGGLAADAWLETLPDPVANGDFTTWTLAAFPDNWIVGAVDANNFVEEHANGCRIVSDGSLSVNMHQLQSVVVDHWYMHRLTISDHVVGALRMQSGTDMETLGPFTIPGTAGDGVYYYIAKATATGASGKVELFRQPTVGCDYVISSWEMFDLGLVAMARSPADGQRGVLSIAGDKTAIFFNKVSAVLQVTIPVGGWGGQKIYGTEDVTLTLDAAFAAGDVDTPKNNGLYMPGTLLYGLIFTDGVLTADEQESIEDAIISIGAGTTDPADQNITSMLDWLRFDLDTTAGDISNWNVDAVTTMENIFRANNNLVTLEIGNIFDTSICVDYTVSFQACALDVASVNAILVSIEAAGTSTGVLDIDGGTSAAPTGAGATAETALQGRGWTVATNP